MLNFMCSTVSTWSFFCRLSSFIQSTSVLSYPIISYPILSVLPQSWLLHRVLYYTAVFPVVTLCPILYCSILSCHRHPILLYFLYFYLGVPCSMLIICPNITFVSWVISIFYTFQSKIFQPSLSSHFSNLLYTALYYRNWTNLCAMQLQASTEHRL